MLKGVSNKIPFLLFCYIIMSSATNTTTNINNATNATNANATNANATNANATNANATNANNEFNIQLNESQRFLINTYMNMYNSTLREITLLHQNLDDIRTNIFNAANPNYIRNMRTPTIRRRFRNSTIPDAIFQLTETNETTPLIIRNSNNSNNSNNRNDREFTNLIQRLVRNFDNISIIPTIEQINNAVIHTTYGEIENPVNTECPISLQPFFAEQQVGKIRHCGHIFDNENLNLWFQRNVHCPMCRYDIREFNTSNINTERSQPPQENQFIIENMQYDDDRIIFDITNNPETSYTSNNNFTTQIIEELLRGQSQQTTSFITQSSTNSVPLFDSFLTPRRL
jgi:hypothetical protein